MAIDVTSWLHQLDLAQYAATFRKNDVDGDVLPHLTAEDLTTIGVTSVGHRRKLLFAIAELSAETGPQLGPGNKRRRPCLFPRQRQCRRKPNGAN